MTMPSRVAFTLFGKDIYWYGVLMAVAMIIAGLVLAQSIGRWGNFVNQEAYGLPVTPEMLAAHPILGYFPISVPIEGAHYFDKVLCTACATAANGAHLHLATFFYESAWCLLLSLIHI